MTSPSQKTGMEMPIRPRIIRPLVDQAAARGRGGEADRDAADDPEHGRAQHQRRA